MEKTLELAPPSVLFRALLGACEAPGEALPKPLPWEVSHSPPPNPHASSPSVIVLNGTPATLQQEADRQTKLLADKPYRQAGWLPSPQQEAHRSAHPTGQPAAS